MLTYYHQLDPFLIHFGGNFGIRWYSLAYISVFVFFYFAGLYLMNKGRFHIPKEKFMDVVTMGVVGTILGGRLGYCIFYAPELFVLFDSSFPFWGVLKIHQGGMSSHGGIIGVTLAILVHSYRNKLPFFSLMDLSGLSAALGFFLGRIANFINAELYGRVIEGTSWLAVRFPTELYLWADHPAIYKKQLLSLKKILPSLDKMGVKIPDTYTWENWVSQAAGGDTVYESYVSYVCNLIVQVSHQPSIKAYLEPLLFFRYPSQLYQSFFGGLIPFVIVSLLWLKPRKAGVISLVWLCSYLFFRIFTELYRQPDSHVGFQFLDLTRGQWLSISFYAIVLVYGYLVYKQEPKGFRG